MAKSLTLLAIGLLLIACFKSTAVGASEQTTTAEISPSSKSAVRDQSLDACTVVSVEKIASIFGHAVQGEPKRLEAADGGFHVSQCRVALKDGAGIIDIRIVQKGTGPKARDPRDTWNESFAPQKVEQAKAEAHRAKWIPEEVRGVGDAAFWRGDNKEGSLYALKGNAYVRISLSSGEARNEKLRKCSALAAAFLKHL